MEASSLDVQAPVAGPHAHAPAGRPEPQALHRVHHVVEVRGHHELTAHGAELRHQGGHGRPGGARLGAAAELVHERQARGAAAVQQLGADQGLVAEGADALRGPIASQGHI